MADHEMSHRTRTREPGRTQTPTPAVLDELAHVVAAALDGGDDAHAWALTRALEDLAGTDGGSARPPGPVIGRRFARAHRLLLDGASAVLAGARPAAAP
ncbi:MAG: hypothetical protein WD080_06210 [Egibacteraceae bacterium]